MNTMKNRVYLVGNLGNDPEIKSFGEGKQVARFSLATTEIYKDATGKKASSTQWHNLVAWNNVAAIAGKLLKKGNEVAIEGRLINRSYDDKEGNKRYITEVVVNEMLLLRSKKSE